MNDEEFKALVADLANDPKIVSRIRHIQFMWQDKYNDDIGVWAILNGAVQRMEEDMMR